MSRMKRVLVCEDNQDTFTVLGELFREYGFEATRAKDGLELEQALRMARDSGNWYELVMVDLDLRLSGEMAPGQEIFYRLRPEFPNESWVIYTSQEVEELRGIVNELSLRHIDFAFLDTKRLHESMRQVLMRTLPVASAADVFLVHGRDLRKKEKLHRFLDVGLGLQVMDWEEARSRVTEARRDYIFEIVLAGMHSSKVTVVLFTDDEEVRLVAGPDRRKRGEGGDSLRRQSRANVYLEAGYALGVRPARTVLVEWARRGKVINQPSDLDGIHVVRFDGCEKSRETLKRRLEATRCDFRPRRDWKRFELLSARR